MCDSCGTNLGLLRMDHRRLRYVSIIEQQLLAWNANRTDCICLMHPFPNGCTPKIHVLAALQRLDKRPRTDSMRGQKYHLKKEVDFDLLNTIIAHMSYDPK